MIHGKVIPNDRLYEPVHTAEVLKDMQALFGEYFKNFAPDKGTLDHHITQAISVFEHEQPLYENLLDPDNLAEFEYDPGTFKSTLRRDCPIMRRSLKSPAKEMDKYRKSFNGADGKRMLSVMTHLSEFASQYMRTFNASQQLAASHPQDLGVSILDTNEDYMAYGVIGGGIRSHFLFNLHPDAFPNRSQLAVWAYYFLSGRKDYGFEDDSEFLMINSDQAGTQQNYYYPYDLFCFYAARLYPILENACQELNYHFDQRYRYLYLDAFLDHVAISHQDDINTLKPPYEEFNY